MDEHSFLSYTEDGYPIFKHQALDYFLYLGAFRYGMFMHHTSHTQNATNKTKVAAFPLRYRVQDVKLQQETLRLALNNCLFSVHVESYTHSQEIDDLYDLYYQHSKYDRIHNLRWLLMDIGNIVFNTKVVKIYHEKQLIGAGIFDEGKSSIAGITNIVHPNYTKYALGKYIMLQKYIYAGEQDMLYYYPGYFMPEYPIFNYKLFIDKAATEVYLFVLKKWIPYLQFEELWQSYATQLILLAGDESIF